MSSFEAQRGSSEYGLIEEVLAHSPPVPVGSVDISQITEGLDLSSETDQPGWAWTRLPSWIAEIEATYDRIGDKPIVALDLCSSVPIYAQRLRFFEFDRDGNRAADLVKEMFDNQTMAELGRDKPLFKQIQTAITKQSPIRQLLKSAVQESLYEITPEEASESNASNPTFKERFERKLTTQRQAYVHINQTSEADRYYITGQHIGVVEHDRCYRGQLYGLQIPLDTLEVQEAKKRLATKGFNKADAELVGQKRALSGAEISAYIDWQADFIAERVVGKQRYRPARFLSMDKAKPEDIALSALANMPSQAINNTDFNHAIASLFKPEQHLTGSLFEPLPFPDNSLALITCFDAWPFHFQFDPDIHPDEADYAEVISSVLANLYAKLAHGGKLVIFPWSIQSEDYPTTKGYTRSLPDVVASFCESVDEQFSLKGIHKNTLKKYMSYSDLETSASLSPIFRNPYEDCFYALVISKSKKSSLESLRRKSLGDLAVTSQTQD